MSNLRISKRFLEESITNATNICMYLYNDRLMKLYLCIFVLLISGSAFGQQPFIDRFTKVPDLTPELKPEKYQESLDKRYELIKNLSESWDPETRKWVAKVYVELSKCLPKVESITIYSLDPVSDKASAKYSLDQNTDSWRQDRFHDYPIMGSVVIKEKEAANRWTDFLRSQIVPGASFACDFEPRHGFRLSTADGDIDFLMCFKCSQLGVIGGPKFNKANNPLFFDTVKDVVNTLFDDKKIPRDHPKKE